MLTPQLHGSNTKATTNLTASPFQATASHQFSSSFSFPRHLPLPPSTLHRGRSNNGELHVVGCSSNKILTVSKSKDAPVTVKAIVSVQITVGGLLTNVGTSRGLDDITDSLGRSILLELVSADLDPNTGLERKTIAAYARKKVQKTEIVTYEAEFLIKGEFGGIGAVLVENEHHKEMFLKDIVLYRYGDAPVTVVCNSWVHAKSDSKEKRVFFANKAYLPSQTPSGLERLRRRELGVVRGDGQGERKKFERVYDYDVYNDLGNPDKGPATARPVLGGKKHPYPRRCRTGRRRTKTDPDSESREGAWYVPRDEAFSEVKTVGFNTKTVRSALHAVVPVLETAVVDPKLGFPFFSAIDKLFDEGISLPKSTEIGIFRSLLPRLLKTISDGAEHVLLFEIPEMLQRDKFAWFRDEEFSRQTLAGLNPLSIELVTEFPFVSKLDPKVYGPPESLITKELIENQINGLMTVEEALEQKRLFVIDYHDLLLPYVHKVRELEDSTLYGSRTVFFLLPEDTLKMIAIELTRPASPTQPQWKKVFTPSWCATGAWLWKFAKVHVCAHDAGYHQLVSHWLRTHCCMEPYVIAANRHLSVMHPIYRLLDPHFRYTMEINTLAREFLINAGGIIESCFAPGKYSIELSSVAYHKQWRFDMEALPADLIRRGMAVEDPEAEHGLRLTIKDYPYANDGLLIWSAIKEWVQDNVSHYYPDPTLVTSDHELQNWWKEVKTKGHADKKDEPWWPSLETPEDLAHILTTIMWVGSGHHAAVNFGQYHYGGYFPNRPTVARTKMPVEDGNEDEFERFLHRPERSLLECFPSQIQATTVMTILDVLSTHASDEEYIGELDDTAFPEEPVIRAAYERFSGKLKEIEGIIDARNLDHNLKNRNGAGVVPYELLKPSSKPGVTGMGVPNSISV